MSMHAETVHQLPPEEKIRTFGEMKNIVRHLTSAGRTAVLGQGAFDLMHVGHTNFLDAVSRIDPYCGIVIVGVESDEALRVNKGVTRPVNPERERLKMLAQLSIVDLVFPYEDAPPYNQPEAYIRRYRALGSDVVIAAPSWDPYRDLKEYQAREADTPFAVVHYRQSGQSTTEMLLRVGYPE